MSSSFALLLASAAIAQPADAWLLTPRLTAGQEFQYRGTHVAESIQDGTPFRHDYELEVLVFVLEATPRGAEVALMTVLREPGAGRSALPGSVRLELATLDARGRLGGPWLPPLDGPPTLEAGMLVEAPPRRLAVGDAWDATEPTRPPRAWKALGAEAVRGVRCVRLGGVQQTDEWDHPTGAGACWRRLDAVWLAPHTGLAHRVERTIERRDATGGTTASKARTSYELVSQLDLPDRATADRRREVQQAGQFFRKLAELRGRPGDPAYAGLLARIDHHLAGQPATPFRPAVQWAKRQAEAGRRGEAPAIIQVAAQEPAVRAAELGRPAPDFVAADLTTGASFRLLRARGRPALLVFFRPDSATAAPTLRLAEAMRRRCGDGVTVAVLAVAGDAAAAARLRDAHCPGVPLLAGRSAATQFAPEATPRFVVLDAAGVVCHLGDGWGTESTALVVAALETAQGVGNPK